MDFKLYENSTMIVDKSAWQHVEFSIKNSDVDVCKFLNDKKIRIAITNYSAEELVFQPYSQTLFSGKNNDGSTITASSLNIGDNYILSNTEGSLTSSNFDTGLNVQQIVDTDKIIFQNTLWDLCPSMEKLKRSKRILADVSNIYLAKFFNNSKKNFFIFVNDQEQIKQINIEGFKYLRPDKLFLWMCQENYISRQKGVWDFERKRKHNNRWHSPNASFKYLITQLNDQSK